MGARYPCQPLFTTTRKANTMTDSNHTPGEDSICEICGDPAVKIMLTDLQRLLPMAEKVIDRQSALPILKEICISGGQARVTDLETMLTMPVADQGSYTIPVALLKKVLATKPQTLKIVPGEDSRVTIEYDDLSVTYQGKDPEGFPAVPDGKFKSRGRCPRDLFQALAIQTSYCSTDELRPSLQGVHLSQDKDQVTLTATDGHVLRRCSGLQGGKEAFQVIIPVKPLLLLGKLARGHTEVAGSARHLRFELPGDVTMYVRFIDEKYPDVEAVIPKEFSGEWLLDRDKTLAIIKAAKAFASRDTHLAVVDLSNGQTLLLVDDLEKQTSWQAPLPVTKQSGEQIRLGFDLYLLEKVLHGQQSPIVRWQCTSPNAASVITEVGKQWQSGVQTSLMPIRLK